MNIIELRNDTNRLRKTLKEVIKDPETLRFIDACDAGQLKEIIDITGRKIAGTLDDMDKATKEFNQLVKDMVSEHGMMVILVIIDYIKDLKNGMAKDVPYEMREEYIYDKIYNSGIIDLMVEATEEIMKGGE